MSLSLRQRIAATPDWVWARLSDHEAMTSWAQVRSVRLVKSGHPDRNGVGAVRRISLLPGLSIDEEVVAFEPPHRMEYRIVGGLPGLASHRGVVTLLPDGPEATWVSWTISLEMRLPLAGLLIEAAVKQRLGRGLATIARQAG